MQYFIINIFRRLKRGFKRVLIFILILSGISITILTIINMRKFFRERDTIKVFIDAGSGNETAHLIPTYRALIAPELDIIGISSNPSQSGSENINDNTNPMNNPFYTLLNQMGIITIPLLQGLDGHPGYWAAADRKLSEASVFFINEAHKTKKEEKLNIIALGSLTNVAAAISADEKIIPRIRLYFSGFKYDSKFRVWNKNEPNVRKDLDAADILLDTPGLEMHIMTATTSENLRITDKEIGALMRGKGGALELLHKKWNTEPASDKEKIMNHLALIEALANPQYAKEKPMLTPPENSRREVFVYTYINHDQMLMAFEKSIKKKFRRKRRN